MLADIRSVSGKAVTFRMFISSSVVLACVIISLTDPKVKVICNLH
jgi:hypothetical protein